MGFISFNETYYRRKLETFENKKLTETDVHEIRQLLKVLDDLTDEGYTNLNDRMEADFSCLSRLRALLKREGVSPFVIAREGRRSTSYMTEEHELSSLLETLMEKAKEAEAKRAEAKEAETKEAEAKEAEPFRENPFLEDIHAYCRWLEHEKNGSEKDAAHVFLLRDTLLPYVHFRKKCGQNVHPWLISRRFLEDVTGVEYVDDDIRLPIYEALENGHTDFEDCCSFCKKGILDVLEQHPKLKHILLDLLNSVKEERIVVIESGYMGTIPMMLKALDDRVTFRLYATAPFLQETYAGHVFCNRYEDMRKFETVCAQDLLTRYASFRDSKFYVNISEDEEVVKRSLAEINDFMR